MSTTNSFPQVLLTQPVGERLQYFADKIIAHPHLLAAYQAVRQGIDYPAGASLIFVYGPTGVGKTTLRLRLEQQLLTEALTDPERNPSHIPVVGLEVVAPEMGRFNWKDYYRRALEALEEPVMADKVAYNLRGIARNSVGELIFGYSVGPANLRHALESCLHYRQPRAFFVDEAQHFKKVATGRRLLDQMDTLKSLAGVTNTVHVLLGTYELLDLSNLSAQLSRRSLDIHLPRYRADKPEEVQIFQNIVLTFQNHLPLVEPPDLVAQYEYLYEKSVGCVGILKDWLYEALALALEEDAPTLTIQHLEKRAKSNQKLLRFMREIKEGETLLTERETEVTELRSLLGLAVQSVSKTQPAPRVHSGVAKRLPSRDKVGGD